MIAGRRPAARGPSAFARNIDELRTAFPDIRLEQGKVVRVWLETDRPASFRRRPTR